MATPKLLTYFKTIKSDRFGSIPLTGIQNIKPYSTVNVEIINSPKQSYNLKAVVVMGKLSGTTLGQRVGTFSLTAKIRTFTVVGPELSVWIKGAPPRTNVKIQAWVFLH